MQSICILKIHKRNYYINSENIYTFLFHTMNSYMKSLKPLVVFVPIHPIYLTQIQILSPLPVQYVANNLLFYPHNQ